MSASDLALFAHVVARPEPVLDLAQAALLLAEPEYPGLDIPACLGTLDRLAEAAAPTVRTARRPLVALAAWLHGPGGFRGNAADYYDPRNSYLNEVLARRTGIPITLALVLLETARRLGIEAHGVAFPGHFLVRGALADAPPLLVDPFEGTPLDAAQLRSLYARATGESRDPEASMLEPAGKRQILARMLHNLRGVHAARGDEARLAAVRARLELLAGIDDAGRRAPRADRGPVGAPN